MAQTPYAGAKCGATWCQDGLQPVPPVWLVRVRVPTDSRMGAHGIYKSSQLRAVHAAAFLYADNELKQLDGLDQSASYGAFMNPATYSHWMNPAAFIHMMNPAQYRQGMNQNAYAQFMNPAIYMQGMPPASYAMSATANMQSGFNMFGPNACGKLFTLRLPKPLRPKLLKPSRLGSPGSANSYDTKAGAAPASLLSHGILLGAFICNDGKASAPTSTIHCRLKRGTREKSTTPVTTRPSAVVCALPRRGSQVLPQALPAAAN